MSVTSSSPQLRPYQHEAVHRVLQWFRSTNAPALLSLPTGAGKSLVIAELARLAKGRVLVLAHVSELVEQNQAKYAAYGLEADIFSAGLGSKKSASQVVFGSVQSVANNLASFTSSAFTLLIIDECHRVSLRSNSIYQRVIQHLHSLNPNLKILGLTATPYRLGQGFIYHLHQQHQAVRGAATSFFQACIYELPLRWMVKQGFLVAPKRLDMAVLAYDFSKLQPTSSGYFAVAELEQAAVNQRVTPQIVADIQQRSAQRQGVMIFCASLRHAAEVTSLLPANSSALITGTLSSRERQDIIQRFKQRHIKYLVNVAVLTTGFDAPHVDVIALLRPTESVSLYQQIIGRGLRLSPETHKQDCLILDYAGNPWDLWAPEVDSPKPSSATELVQVICPSCGFANSFWGITASNGEVIEHFGRRCHGWWPDESASTTAASTPTIITKGVQCDFRFRFRVCNSCGAEADIAARVCPACAATLIDADTQLKQALSLKNALVLRVGAMQLQLVHTNKGQERLQVTYYDEDGTSLNERYALATAAQRYIFAQVFWRTHAKAPGIEPNVPASIPAAIAQADHLRYPDFVIARKVGTNWRIQHKIFDYQGRYRTGIAAS